MKDAMELLVYHSLSVQEAGELTAALVVHQGEQGDSPFLHM